MTSIKITITHQDRDYLAEIAAVESTLLGPEDHGIWTAQLTFAGPSWSQSSPGYTLTSVDQIIRIVETLACGDWEHVKGVRCYVLRDTSPHGQIVGIADLHGERTLLFSDTADLTRAS
jgi:hypothetical protein